MPERKIKVKMETVCLERCHKEVKKIVAEN
jgi:hypothetical protein